jgi:hypothetical protein
MSPGASTQAQPDSYLIQRNKAATARHKVNFQKLKGDAK